MTAEIRLARQRDLMEKHGIKYPTWTQRAAREAGLPLSIACALLEQESGGGHNVFGHDPVRGDQIRGGKVTREKYRKYKRLRKAGYGMQGVGPMQLTWYEFQDRADRIGGCWKPYPNMKVGFSIAADLIKRKGRVRGLAAYNGSGFAAWRYSRQVRRRAKVWHRRLSDG